VTAARRKEFDPAALAKIIVDIAIDELGGRPIVELPWHDRRRPEVRPGERRR